jgi:hypothetical protein
MTPKDDRVYELRGALRPDLLEQVVNELPDVPEIDLAEYATAIKTLHDAKAFSFSEIVGFLREHGVETNRSAVYRVYKEASQAAPDERNPDDDPLFDEDTGEVVEP